MLVIDCNKRNQLKVEEIEKTYTQEKIMAKVKSSGKPFRMQKSEYKWVECKEEGCIEEVKIDSTAEAGMCWRCTMKMVDIPAMLRKPVDKDGEEKIRRHRGWRFMKEYVDSEGNVFFRGVEQLELKGKKEPTVIEPKKKKTAFEKERDRAAKEAKLAAKHERKLVKQNKLNGNGKKNGKGKYTNKPKGVRNKK